MSSLVKYISLEILTKELLLEIWYTKLILLISSKKNPISSFTRILYRVNMELDVCCLGFACRHKENRPSIYAFETSVT